MNRLEFIDVTATWTLDFSCYSSDTRLSQTLMTPFTTNFMINSQTKSAYIGQNQAGMTQEMMSETQTGRI